MALRIALLGCGPLGAQYAQLAAASGSTVFVVFDGDHDGVTRIAQQAGARIAPSLNDAVTAVGVDAIVVCVGGTERLEAINAATAARRPVFDAMPLSSEVVPTLIAVQDAGFDVGVDLRRRHDIGIRAAADAVRNGEIGDVRSCSIVSRDDTVSFEESVIHDLDLARHLIGSEIVDVAGIRGRETTMLLLTHVSGAITSIENSRHAPAGAEHRIELTGANGTVSSGPSSRQGAIITTADGERRVNRADDAVARSLAAQWTSFVDAVRSGESSGTATDVDAALLAARAVAVALAEGRTVRVAALLSAP